MKIEVKVFERTSRWKTAAGEARSGWSWWARWKEVAGESVDGEGRTRVTYRDRMRSLKTQNASVARKMAVALEEALNRSQVGVGRMDWERALTLHSEYHGESVVNRTMDRRVLAWNEFWTFVSKASQEGGALRFVDEVRQYHVLRWRKSLQEAGLVPCTINGKVLCCHAVVARLIQSQLYEERNPFAGIKHLDEPESERDTMTEEEIVEYLGVAGKLSLDFQLFCALGVYAGLRLPSTGLACRWGWIHWGEGDVGGHIRVPKSDGPRFTVKDKEARCIPLARPLACLLRPHRGTPGAYVVRPDKTEWAKDAYRVDFRRHLDALREMFPGKRITAYCLRHTFATTCVRNGVPAYKVMRWMGHNSLEMLRRYAHLAPVDDDIEIAFPDRDQESR